MVSDKTLLTEFVGFLSTCPDLHCFDERGLLRDQPQLALKLVDAFLAARQAPTLRDMRRAVDSQPEARMDVDLPNGVVIHDPNSPDGVRTIPRPPERAWGDSPHLRPGSYHHGGRVYESSKRLPDAFVVLSDALAELSKASDRAREAIQVFAPGETIQLEVDGCVTLRIAPERKEPANGGRLG